ncbi:BZ3500_MvSof-1268-A1-R1_Chr1-3g02059 [Microbotryum saponariae]|uniref:BZ3500_MvSof-1268-A1-R1_Chr1-3g02059 protein n=1 Tax=Microbotryum saponariae TaxID=289078 RepID=A0A2X0KU57_9BASI|nr:BZ3500_MvSof-1268-A1-R1_Chr1-3g02059 [Microbotryum saponariae]SCZ95286.1 BZ3501_MvSof-1269-A2-R1_Chr1-3g01661 [Microbotryum saponariae]
MSAWLARLAVGSSSSSSSRRVSQSGPTATSTSAPAAGSSSRLGGGAAAAGTGTGTGTGTGNGTGNGTRATEEQALALFVRTWESIKASLGLPPAQRASTLCNDLIYALDHLLHLLKSEQTLLQSSTRTGDPPALGPCLEHLLKHAILASLVKLVLDGQQPRVVRTRFIEWVNRVIHQLEEGFLIHGAVNKPLLKLLRTCVDSDGGLHRDEELAVVQVMASICERIRAYPQLLAIFLREKVPSNIRRGSASHQYPRSLASITVTAEDSSSPRPVSPTPSTSTLGSVTSPSLSQVSSSGLRTTREHDFLLFAYLLRFVHREGQLGDQARLGLLQLVEVAIEPLSTMHGNSGIRRSDTMGTPTPELYASSSSKQPWSTPISMSAIEARLAFAEFLLDSDFADVLGAGLGALYGLLPSKLIVRSRETTGPSTASVEAMSSGGVGGGGGVLGGMGSLIEDEDEEALQRRREEEDARLLSLGFGLTGTDDFRQNFDGFLKPFEFIQEVVQKVDAAIQATKLTHLHDEELDDPMARQHRLVISALPSTILSSLRTSFLQSVLYPSILECDETDGSAVAVMSYLDALLDVIDEGTSLEACLLGFLMGEEDDVDAKVRQERRRGLEIDSPLLQGSPMPHTPADASSNFLSPNRISTKMSLQRVKRRKSNALILLEKSTEKGSAAHASYFTSYGRFTLKDMLVANLHSTSQPTSTAALKLLQTMLKRHDRWSIGLLDVVLDDAATSFPVVVRREAQEEVDLEDDELDVEEFVYPTMDDSSLTFGAPRTLGRPMARMLLGPPLPPTPSIQSHTDIVDTLLGLVGSIDPAYRSARAVGGGSEMISAGYANYLRDAEAALAGDLAFKRGLSARNEAEHAPPVKTSPIRTRLTGLFGTVQSGASSLTPRDFARTSTMYRHRIDPDSSAVVALVLDSLTHFFSHSPDLNLALTGVISSLAICPYRSLDRWLLPPIPSVNTDSNFTGFARRGGPTSSGEEDTLSDDGDDRSVDFEMGSPSRSRISDPSHSVEADLNPFIATMTANLSSIRSHLNESDSVLAIVDALVRSVRHYRATIPNFDACLAERRNVLFFVENLADALALDDPEEVGVKMQQQPFVPVPTPIVVKPTMGRTSSFMEALGFSTPSKPKSTRSEQLRAQETSSTPPTQREELSSTPSRNGSTTTATTTTGQETASSPFVAHYRQTGSITVEPIIVSTPRTKRVTSTSPILTRSSTRFASSTDEDEDESGLEGDDDPSSIDVSPTKRISPLPRSPSTSTGKNDDTPSSTFSTTTNTAPAPRPVPNVSLSTILDNVIVLEEFIKELAGVVGVRRSLGVDGATFLT